MPLYAEPSCSLLLVSHNEALHAVPRFGSVRREVQQPRLPDEGPVYAYVRASFVKHGDGATWVS